VLLFALFFLMGLGGHGFNPFGFVFYLMYPSCFLLELLPSAWQPESDMILVLLCVIAGFGQYALIGYVVDRILARRKTKIAK
jgi:hypothetical protein